MQTDTPQFWTDEMIAQFREYYLSEYGDPECLFNIFEKIVYLSIEDELDDSQNPRRSVSITYSCHVFGGLLLQSIPFYLDLSTEADYYKESNIGYVQIVNRQNYGDEPQAKILACVRQSLGIESRLDNFITGLNNKITLRFYRDVRSKTDIVGIKLPIRELEIEYTQGQSKEKWLTR